MKTRKTCWLVLALFYISIPVTLAADKIAILVKGYGINLALYRFGADDHEMFKRYYDAYRNAFPLMHDIVLAGILMWVTAFVFFAFMVFMRFNRKIICLPAKLDLITVLVSLGLMVFAVVSAAVATGARAAVM